MKVLFIAPPIRESSAEVCDGTNKSIIMDLGVFPHLGICYMAALLQEHHIEVSIIDLNVEKLSFPQIVQRIKEINPSVIGITSMTFTFLYALRLSREIRKCFSTPVVLGGVHPTLYPREVLSHDSIDVVVIGEGEATFLELVNHLSGGLIARALPGLEEVKGIAFKKGNGEVVVTAPRPLIENLDDLPPPAIGLIDARKYFRCNLAAPSMNLITARGCPSRCVFCSKTPWGQSYRSHSPRRVVDEVEDLVKNRGMRSVEFQDDTFTVNKAWVREILRLLKERKIRVEFGIATRVNAVDKELLMELRQAGCQSVGFGVESGDPRILKAMKKDITLEQIRNAFQWAREAGLNAVGLFMVGNPTETEESVKKTIALIKEIRPAYLLANVLIPYPGSELYADMVKNRLQTDYWKQVTLAGKAGLPPLANEGIPLERLIDMRNYLSRLSYMNLNILDNLRKIRNIRGWRDFVRPFRQLKSSLTDKRL